MHATTNEVCKPVISVNTLCLAIVYTGWNGVSQSFKSNFCNCDGVLLSLLGIAKLRVAMLSRAIEESCLEETYRNGLYAEPCSGKLLWADLSVEHLCVTGYLFVQKGHLCNESPKWTGWLSEVMLDIWGIPHAGCISSKVPACRDKRYGRWEPACQNAECTSCQSVWLPWAWALWSSDPESELGWFL